MFDKLFELNVFYILDKIGGVCSIKGFFIFLECKVSDEFILRNEGKMENYEELIELLEVVFLERK